MLARSSGKVLESFHHVCTACLWVWLLLSLALHTDVLRELCLLNGSTEVEMKQSNIFNSSRVYSGMQHAAFSSGICVFCGVYWTLSVPECCPLCSCVCVMILFWRSSTCSPLSPAQTTCRGVTNAVRRLLSFCWAPFPCQLSFSAQEHKLLQGYLQLSWL